MTSEELKAAAAVMLAASEGAEIEFCTRTFGKPWGVTMHPSNVSWDWTYSDYRVKQERPQSLGQILYDKLNQGTETPWSQCTQFKRSEYQQVAAFLEAEVLKRQREACTPMRDLPSKPSP